MTNEEIKNEFINCIEGSHTLNLAISILEDREELQQRIDELNKTNKCKIVFDGLLNGDDFVKYCQQCHIGLSTQSMTGEYLQTSFPSKILSYMCMGLHVVSCYVECVSTSTIGDIVTYYYSDTSEDIASAIKSVNIDNVWDVVTERMSALHKNFSKKLEKLIKNT